MCWIWNEKSFQFSRFLNFDFLISSFPVVVHQSAVMEVNTSALPYNANDDNNDDDDVILLLPRKWCNCKMPTLMVEKVLNLLYFWTFLSVLTLKCHKRNEERSDVQKSLMISYMERRKKHVKFIDIEVVYVHHILSHLMAFNIISLPLAYFFFRFRTIYTCNYTTSYTYIYVHTFLFYSLSNFECISSRTVSP